SPHSDNADEQTNQSEADGAEVESSLEHEMNEENEDTHSESEEAENDQLKDSEGYYLAAVSKDENPNEQKIKEDESTHLDNTDEQTNQSETEPSEVESSLEPEIKDENEDTHSEIVEAENDPLKDSEGYYLAAVSKDEHPNEQKIQEGESPHSDNADEQTNQSE